MPAEKNIGYFLFELGAEELPSGQITNISNHIKNGLTNTLNEAGLDGFNIETYSTPRRLVWIINNLNLDTVRKELEIKGPPETIAKAADGTLTAAGQGFLKRNNLSEKEVFSQDGYLCAKQIIEGKNAKAILEEKIPELVASTTGTRFMRWAYGDLKFARPLQWLLAIVVKPNKDFEILNFQIEGLVASNKTRGHRFLSSEDLVINSKEDLFTKLELAGVCLDNEKRREKIINDANKLAQSVAATVVFNDSLLDELVMITENPAPILCQFNSQFLSVPDCVLKTVMIHHQRYLPLEKDSKLTPYFITVSNNPLSQAIANIKEGNEKVIVPRFKDAEFFVAEDSKLSLVDRLTKLDKVNFLKGTFLQKSQRLEKIVKHLIEELKPNFSANPDKELDDSLDEQNIQNIIEAAKLAKADLTTNLVFEFTELQGEIGGIYAEKQGHNKVTAAAIAEHYRPRFADDQLPNNIGAKLISIADKIDNIVCAFALGKIPSGSADPFALRRQANGLLETIIHGRLLINTATLVDLVVDLQKADFGSGNMITKIKGRGEERREVQVPELEWDNCHNLVKDFLTSRLPFVFEIYHKNTDINKAVLAKPNALTELNKRHMMIHLLNSLRTEQKFTDLVAATTRIINISKAAAVDSKIDTKLFELDYEKQLFNVVQKLEINGQQNLAYIPLIDKGLLLEAAQPINQFFDNVLVNAEDEKIKENRKALVSYASKVFAEIADFSLL